MTDPRPLRVAFVAHFGRSGGADLLLQELVIALTEHGLCECLVVVPSDQELAADLRAAGVRVALAQYEWWCSYRQEDERPSALLATRRAIYTARTLWPSAKTVIRALQGFSPEVVASNTCVIPVGALAAARMRVPHVWLAQEYGRADYGFAFFFGYSRSMRLLGASSKSVIAISHALGRALEQYVARRKIHVLHAASAMPLGSPLGPRAPGEPLRLISLNSGLRTKGFEEAIRAVGIARSRGVDVELRLVGSHDEAVCSQLAAAAGVTEAVTIVGRVEDVVAEIDRAHVGLMCSRLEAFGRVTVEYLRRGRPVIGTRSGGTPEIVEDGVAGLLYDPGDIQGLADQIEYVASSNAILVKLSRAALEQSADRFLLSDYLSQFHALLLHARDARTGLDGPYRLGSRHRPAS